MVVLSLTFLVQTMNPDVWSSGYPDSTCADLPRITAAMYKTGYIDLPAIARRPLICVAGEPSVNRTRFKKEEACNRAAVWNAEKKQCECRNPEADGRVMKPELYGQYPPGERRRLAVSITDQNREPLLGSEDGDLFETSGQIKYTT
ncbi:hypothetical protein Y032_0041g399 [Ancylostoma ceylanicum]|uniref:Uncharacterized protein n=1 Tax=Ancylostoma ceylanicum TaxID=53326 RepID=A0A016UFU9_9BILA|nr:hypothetical protein Y032_0041g399 [Ancylostoma ceylanicum]